MHGLQNITVHEPFLMKQLEKVLHQNEGENQEREKHSISKNKDIIRRGYRPGVKGTGHQLCPGRSHCFKKTKPVRSVGMCREEACISGKVEAEFIVSSQ